MKRQTTPNKRKNHKGKWEGRQQESRPAFVPRQIVDRFMSIKGIREVKPLKNERDEMEIIVVAGGGYSHQVHGEFLTANSEIEQSLKSRGQRFYASISW